MRKASSTPSGDKSIPTCSTWKPLGSADRRGRITVNEWFQTQVPHIYAAGDCIGFPALASTSMEQGRLAAGYMFQKSANGKSYPLPYGIYTIPEISMIGKTERELTEAKIPYEVGSPSTTRSPRGKSLEMRLAC
jgi:NAD(P) transhydrogenase